MGSIAKERWAEHCQELLEDDLIGALDNDGADRFYAHVFKLLGDGMTQLLINSWLSTAEGIRWYEKALQRMIENAPDGDN